MKCSHQKRKKKVNMRGDGGINELDRGYHFSLYTLSHGTLKISYNFVNYTLIKKKLGGKKRIFLLPQKETPSSLAVIPYFPSHQPLTTANLSVSRDFLF